MKNKIIAVDFDGTLCENRYPEIGEPNEELIKYLIKRQVDGDKLILWTCRCGDILEQAVNWCHDHGLVFDAVNDNGQMVATAVKFMQTNILMIKTYQLLLV